MTSIKVSISKIYNVPTKTHLTNDNLEKASIKSVKQSTYYFQILIYLKVKTRSGIAYTCTIHADMFGRFPNLVWLSLGQYFRTPWLFFYIQRSWEKILGIQYVHYKKYKAKIKSSNVLKYKPNNVILLDLLFKVPKMA